MEFFDSSFKTLNLSSTSFDFLTVVCSFWTGIAVLTAAVNFCRNKASTTSQSHRKSYGNLDNHLPHSSDSDHLQRTQTLDGFYPAASNPSTLTALEDTQRTPKNPYGECSSSLLRISDFFDGGCKRKFTICYSETGLPDLESLVNGSSDSVSHVYSVRKVEETIVVPCSLKWSWHRHQDFTFLNGSVVRLWNDDYRRKST